MTADELLAYLAAECDEPVDVVADLLQALADTVEERLKAGDTITIPGLGIMHVYRPAQRTRSIVVLWASDTGLRQRVAEALNAQDGRTPIPQGQAQRIKNGKGIAPLGHAAGRKQ